jgi:periplasmic mercuric ion binding protein
MVLLKRAIAGLLTLMLPVLAAAANRTVVLTIPTMDCATCPITIRVALMRVAGVSKAKVSYERREARVTFDDTKTDVAALTGATKDVGHPSFLSDKQP